MFNFNDILSALAHGLFETGPYEAIAPGGTIGDDKVSIVYDPESGNVQIDAGGNQLSGIQIVSDSNIFDTADQAQNLGGPFDVNRADKIAKAVFGESFGDLDFGNIARTGQSEAFLAADLTATGTLSPSGSLSADDIDLIVIPEPASVGLLCIGLAVCVTAGRRRANMRPID